MQRYNIRYSQEISGKPDSAVFALPCSPMERYSDKRILDKMIFKLSCTGFSSATHINDLLEQTKKKSEEDNPCSSNPVVKYLAAIEYFNLVFGAQIDSLGYLRQFSEQNSEKLSFSFQGILETASQEPYRGTIRNAAEESALACLKGDSSRNRFYRISPN